MSNPFPEYKFMDALKARDFCYMQMLVKDWYADNISLWVHHLLRNERCETCRNWHFCGIARFEDKPTQKRMYGTCDLQDRYWQDYHGHCWIWNLDLDEESRGFCREDGCEKVTKLPSGKKIWQISKGGVWQYTRDWSPECPMDSNPEY